MRETGRLNICGLRYRVIEADSHEVPQLEDGDDGATVFQALAIYLRKRLPRSRKRDARLHEIAHAWLEASGVREFLRTRIRGDYDAFEEALIRLAVPSLWGLIKANGGALLSDKKRKKKGRKR